MSTLVDERFSDIVGTRAAKPRTVGKTMVIGDGLYNLGGMNYLADLMEFAGQWIDSYKFQRGVIAIQSPDLVQRKLALFADHDVLSFPGGNFLEAAIHEGVEREWFEAIKDVGCPGIEVSSTAIDLHLERKLELVDVATDMDFHVHVEIGKKSSETGGQTLSEAAVRNEIEAALDAGAEMIILEMEQIEQVRESSEGERSPAAIVEAYAEDYGRERLMFEVPLAPYYDVMESSWWFMDAVGSDVNLGNVAPEYVLPVEQQRRGLGQYAFSDHYVEN